MVEVLRLRLKGQRETFLYYVPMETPILDLVDTRVVRGPEYLEIPYYPPRPKTARERKKMQSSLAYLVPSSTLYLNQKQVNDTYTMYYLTAELGKIAETQYAAVIQKWKDKGWDANLKKDISDIIDCELDTKNKKEVEERKRKGYVIPDFKVVLSPQEYKGALDDGVWNEPTMANYVTSRPGGYTGSGNRTYTSDKLICEILKEERNWHSHVIAVFLNSTRGRHFAGDIEYGCTKEEMRKLIDAHNPLNADYIQAAIKHTQKLEVIPIPEMTSEIELD